MPIASDLYYYQHRGGKGDQPPVILIHGAGGSHLHWPAQVRRLGGYRVYALDLPGHGKSAGRGRQSIEAYAHEIGNWMQSVELSKAVFVGHSMGGAIALKLAIRNPGCVLGLGLVGTGARLKVDPVILEDTAMSVTFNAAVESIAQRAFSPDTDPELVNLAAERMSEIRPSVLHGDFVASDGFDEMDSLNEVGVPTCVICGQDDQLTPPRYSQYLADHIAKAELHILPQAGHMVMLEKPDQVAEILEDFLATIPYPS